LPKQNGWEEQTAANDSPSQVLKGI